ncbi:MAG: hypothetical protein P1P84_24805 [Deferrisomatales bacterium]|nr:hypothetical protein [Deferrisomatales bacterium]
MSGKHRHGKRHRHGESHGHLAAGAPAARDTAVAQDPPQGPARLELVLVSDTVGTLDAVRTVVGGVSVPGVEIDVVHTAVGAVSKSDLVQAATGSRLVLGFNVELNPLVEEETRGQGVEVRLYRVIYHLGRDVEEIAHSLLPVEVEEQVTGSARVIQLFKGGRHDVILGCQVEQGRIAVGDRYRVVGVAGTLHEAVADSLHIGPDAVREARAGQQVGLKIYGFQETRVGDLVEAFRVHRLPHADRWAPRAGVRRVE